MKMHFSIIFMFFMSLLSFVMNRKHMLMMLLSLEFFILSLLFLMFMYFLNLSNDFFLLLFLSFSVCESILGFISVVSSFSWESIMNLLWWNFFVVYYL